MDEEPFQSALDEHPEKFEIRLVFSDWLEEQGDPRAAGMRFLGENKRYPLSGDGHWDGDGHWTWNRWEDDVDAPDLWEFGLMQFGGPIHYCIPRSIWVMMGGRGLFRKNSNGQYLQIENVVVPYFDSRRLAEDAFCMAFLKVKL